MTGPLGDPAGTASQPPSSEGGGAQDREMAPGILQGKRELEVTDLSKPSCSVIVPVFNQWHLVPDLVACLEKQSIGVSGFELILVDNGSDRCPDESTDPEFARRVYCATPGSYAARNAGIVEARAEVFVFTDADCRPEPEWLAEGMRCVYDPGEGGGIVAGAVVMTSRDPEHPARYELYDLVMGIPQERYVRRGYGVTANLFVPRKVCVRLGGFDERRFSGGDAEFCRRAGRMDIAVLYCATARVAHPARRTMEELVRKVRRVKGGQITAGPRWRRMSYALYTFVPPLRVWRVAFYARGFSVSERLSVCAVQLRLWAAEIAELFRQLLEYRPERR